MTHGSLFSGVGGFELGAQWAGIQTLWNCELEPFNRKILNKHFPESHQYADIRELRNPPYVDIISGGFPCQDISIAGKGAGISGGRSGLWGEMYRVVRDVRPRYVIIENSPMLIVRGFERVLCDLSEIGYDAEWQCLSGTTFGIQQGRERVYCIAYPADICIQGGKQETVFREQPIQRESARVYPGWRTRRDIPAPRTLGSTTELPDLVDRIKALGNPVMPLAALYLFRCISQHNTACTAK